MDPTKTYHPLVLAVDASGSMSWPVEGNKTRMELLEEGLENFKDEIQSEYSPFSDWVEFEIGVISFGKNVAVDQDLGPIENWKAETPTPDGTTPMGKAIRESIELVEDRKEHYQNEGLHYRSPTIILITDGEPTDMSPDDEKWNEIQDLIGVGTNDAHFDLLITGIGGEPNMKTLEDLLSETNQSNAQIIQLDDSNISEIGSYVAEFMPGHDLS